YRYINPLTGGADGGGWEFDSDLNSASVFQLLEAVEGVERVEEVLFFEYDLRNHERIGFGKELVKLARDSLFLSANHQVVVRLDVTTGCSTNCLSAWWKTTSWPGS